MPHIVVNDEDFEQLKKRQLLYWKQNKRRITMAQLIKELLGASEDKLGKTYGAPK